MPTARTDGFRGQAPGIVGSFATPILVRAGGRDELVLGLPGEVRAWEPATGRELWRCAGLNPLVYLTPTYGEGLVFAAGGYFGSTLGGRPRGRGGGAAPHPLRHHESHPQGRPRRGAGRQLWLERLKGPGASAETWSSMTLAGDLIYAVNQSGDAFVLRAAPEFELLHTNSLGEYTNSSFAMSDGELFLRTWQGLWCLSEKARQVAVVD